MAEFKRSTSSAPSSTDVAGGASTPAATTATASTATPPAKKDFEGDLKRFQENYSASNSAQEAAEDKFNGQQHALLEEFERRARDVIKQFEAAAAPHEAKLKQMHEPLRRLLDNKYLSISSSLFQSYMEEKKGITSTPIPSSTSTSSTAPPSSPSSSTSSSPSASSSPSLPSAPTMGVTLLRLSTGDNFINYAEACIRRHKTADTAVSRAAKAEADRLKDVATREKKLGERTTAAMTSVMPMFSFLTLDQAIMALEMKKDNATEVIDWMLSTEESEVKFLLTKHVPHRRVDARARPARETKNVIRSHASDDDDDDVDEEEVAAVTAGVAKPKLPAGYVHTVQPLYRNQHLIFRVMGIKNENDGSSLSVDLLGVLDRHRLPMTAVNGRSLRVQIPIGVLWTRLRPHVLTDEEANNALTDYRERVPHVRFERYRNDDTWAPLECTPEVDLKQYTFDYDSDAKKITSMSHIHDGQLVFTCALVEPDSDDDDDGEHEKDELEDEEDELTAALIKPPLVIYTQFLDDHNYSILHWHLRGDVARSLVHSDDHIIDTRHLAGNKYTLEDCCDFPTDAHKRQVDYRFVVKDRRLAAVMHHTGTETRSVPFTEEHIPRVGTILGLPSTSSTISRVAIMESIPTGMMVAPSGTADPRAPVPPLKHIKAVWPPCSHLHSSSYHGHVTVRVILDNNKLLEPPLLLSIPICRVRQANAAEVRDLETAQKARETARVQQLMTALEKLENILVAEKQPFRMTPPTPLTDIANLRATIVALCGEATPSVVKMLLPRIRTAFDGIVTLVQQRQAAAPFVFKPADASAPFTFSLGKR